MIQMIIQNTKGEIDLMNINRKYRTIQTAMTPHYIIKYNTNGNALSTRSDNPHHLSSFNRVPFISEYTPRAKDVVQP